MNTKYYFEMCNTDRLGIKLSEPDLFVHTKKTDLSPLARYKTLTEKQAIKIFGEDYVNSKIGDLEMQDQMSDFAQDQEGGG